MSTRRRPCPCGSGKAMRRCCGVRSSQAKLNLERSARLLAEVGMHTEAAQALAERAKLSPQNPMIWNDLGVQYIAAGQSEVAHAAFKRAHKAFPGYPLPLYNMGRLAMGRCKEEQARECPSVEKIERLATEAIHYLTESLSRDPDLFQAHALLSSAYKAIGDETRSRLHLQEASRLNHEKTVEPKPFLVQGLLLKKLRKPSARFAPPFLLSSGDPINAGTF